MNLCLGCTLKSKQGHLLASWDPFLLATLWPQQLARLLRFEHIVLLKSSYVRQIFSLFHLGKPGHIPIPEQLFVPGRVEVMSGIVLDPCLRLKD